MEVRVDEVEAAAGVKAAAALGIPEEAAAMEAEAAAAAATATSDLSVSTSARRVALHIYMCVYIYIYMYVYMGVLFQARSNSETQHLSFSSLGGGGLKIRAPPGKNLAQNKTLHINMLSRIFARKVETTHSKTCSPQCCNVALSV